MLCLCRFCSIVEAVDFFVAYESVEMDCRGGWVGGWVRIVSWFCLIHVDLRASLQCH